MENLYRKKLEAWKAFHAHNPRVWTEFRDMAQSMVDRGRKHYSHDTIISVIRFNRDLQTTGSEYKIANEFKAFYGRLWMSKYGKKNPRFFHLRQMRGESDEEFSRYYQEESR